MAIHEGFLAEFHFVPFSFNYHELSEIVLLAENIGLKKISILRFVPQGRGTNLQKYILNRYQNLHLKRIVENARKRDLVEIRAGSPYNFLLINDSPACFAAIDRISISPTFDIIPCDAFKQIMSKDVVDSAEYSNALKWPLLKCWEKSPYLNAIRDYLTTDFDEPCVSCKLLDQCLSGCLAQKIIYNGDMKKRVDPLCIRQKD